MRTVEAVIGEGGEVRLLEEEPAPRKDEAALLSEAALAEDWNRPEEDEAWQHFQKER